MLAKIGFPERFGWGLGWVMEGSERSMGRFALEGLRWVWSC